MEKPLQPDSGDEQQFSPDSGNKPSKQTRRSFLLESITATLIAAGCGNALRGIVSREAVPQSDLREVIDGTTLDIREMEGILQEFEEQKARIMPKGKEQEQFFLSVCEELKQNGWKITQDLKDRITSAMEAEFPGEELSEEYGYDSFAIGLASSPRNAFSIAVFEDSISITYLNPIAGLKLYRNIPIKEWIDGRIAKDSFRKDFFDPERLAGDNKNNQMLKIEGFHVWLAKTDEGDERTESVTWSDSRNMISVTRLNGKITAIDEYGTYFVDGRFDYRCRSWKVVK